MITKYDFIFLIYNLYFSDIMDSSVLSTFRKLKGSVDELRGGADAAALISLNFNYCGIGYIDSWR